MTSESTNDAHRDRLIVLTVSDWHEPKRLRQQLSELLSSTFRVVYVTLPQGLMKPRATSRETENGIDIISLKGPPVPLRILEALSLRNMHEHYVARKLQRLLGDQSDVYAVLTFTPEFPRLLGYFQGRPRLYVANDDHSSLANSGHASATIKRKETETIESCESVITVSSVIAARLSRHGKPVHIVYPGHASGSPQAPPATVSDERSACFLGYIDWRIDFSLLDALLARGWRVDLIGPVIGPEDAIRELSRKHGSRFRSLPPINAARAASDLSRYGVLLMPYSFRTQEQSDAMELPNKTFIYLSARRPIVTTDMRNLKAVRRGIIYRTRSSAEFLNACELALQDDSVHLMNFRARIARLNQWPARLHQIRGILAEARRRTQEDI